MNELCRDWVLFLCLAPPCAVQTCLAEGELPTPPHTAWLYLQQHLAVLLSQVLHLLNLSSPSVPHCMGQAFHWTSCSLSELRMVFKYVNILCVQDKLLKQFVKGIIQVVPVSLVYLAVLFVVAQFLILLHNFQDQWEEHPAKYIFKHKLHYFWIWQIRVLSCNQLVKLSEHTDLRAENK